MSGSGSGIMCCRWIVGDGVGDCVSVVIREWEYECEYDYV